MMAAGGVAASGLAAAPPLQLDPKRVEILVYNVSHVDVILGIQRGGGGGAGERTTPDASAEGVLHAAREISETQILARPRFNRFYPLTLKVEEALRSLGDDAGIIDCEFDPSKEDDLGNDDDDDDDDDDEGANEAAVSEANARPARHSNDFTSANSAKPPTHGQRTAMSPARATATAAVGVAAATGTSAHAGNAPVSVASKQRVRLENIDAGTLPHVASTHSLLSLRGGPVVLPAGLSFHQNPVVEDAWDSFSLRKSAGDVVAQETLEEPARISSVMLPLVSQLLFTWLGIVEGISADVTEESTADADVDADLRKVVFLVSGCGTPRNKSLPLESNSTKAAARIIQRFIERTCPTVEVHCLDSGLDVFHYDQNVRFCNDIVLPAIDNLRHPLVAHFGNEWQRRLGMTVALTDGSPARLAALNAALRQYRPSYLHMWQLKSFWYELRFLGSDLIFQSFETMETKPPVPIPDLDPECRLVVEEMRKYKHEFVEAKMAGSLDELSTFWLRKTRKVVLSVLMVRMGADEPPRFYRGMNLEVSMPTGSLCSERNVIGTALASNQTLRRQHFRYIAVLSMTLDPPAPAPMPSPQRLPTPRDGSLPPVPPMPMDSPDPAESPQPVFLRSSSSRRSGLGDAQQTPEGSPMLRPVSAALPRALPSAGVPAPTSSSSSSSSSSSIASSQPGDSPRRVYRRPRAQSASLSVYSGGGGAGGAAVSTQNPRFQGELNPIQPCGACMEWLKKIAEVNPTFKVVTFPNSDCHEAFVQEVG